MSKNKTVMSIAIKPELQAEIKKFSQRKGVSASTFIGNLIEQTVKLNIDDDAVVVGKPLDEELMALPYNKKEVTPVLLKIPSALKNYPEKLRQWLDVQSTGIVKAMTKHLTESEPKAE